MMTTLPEGLTARAPVWSDADAVATLYNACSMAEIGAPDTTAEKVQREWQTPGFNLEHDAWLVATTDGQMIGYTEVWSQEPYSRMYGDGRVHPAYLGRSIGTHLLQWQEARAREIMADAPTEARITLVNRALNTNEFARRLLQDAAFAIERHFWRMAMDLVAEPPAPEWLEGIVVRTAVPSQDERAIYEARDEAFRDHYDYQSIPFETWLHWQTSDPQQYDPSLWFLALDGEQIAGAALCRPHLAEDPGMGWVDDLGVRQPWRRRGLGMALLRHAFGAFYRRGTPRVGLSVDAANLTGATRLYERAGLHVVRQIDYYAKELRPGRDVSEERS